MPKFDDDGGFLTSLWDKDKFEVTLRVGVMSFCGFVLSIADIPSVVPPSQALIPGMMLSTFSQVLPFLVFSATIVPAVVIVMMISICGFTTMLLAAGSVSDNFFMAVYSVFTLLVTALYFGKHYSFTNSFANSYIAMSGLFGLSYLPLVNQAGLSVVADMWTESGTTNALAVWRNFLIALCWALAFVIVAVLLPPFRTSRRMISRFMLPAIFNQISTVLSGADDVDVQALAKSKTSLKGGNVVLTAAFEPRADLVAPLKQIAIDADELIFKSLLVLKWKKGLANKDADDRIDAALEVSSTLLRKCATALASNNEESYGALRDMPDDKTDEEMEQVGVPDRPVDTTDRQFSKANYIYQHVLKVQASVLSYLHTLNTGAEGTHKMSFVLKKAMMYVTIPLLPSLRLVTVFKTVLKPKKWDWKPIMWALELSAGFIGLISMSLYWDAYSSFRIVPRDSYVGPVYSGWELFGYAFAYRPSHEGTVKKGIQRIIGTCLGGFSAWLGIIVCSGSYDNTAEINPYGLVAWLTVFTMGCAYFCTLPSGLAAFGGKNADHGYVGMYFSMTQALIALETYQGAGDKNGLTLNRIVATVSGVLTAIVISFLPPNVNGRDPEHTRDYLNAVEDAFLLLLRTFADETESPKITSEDFKTSLLTTADGKRDVATFLLEDANMLQALPFMKVNQKLQPLLDNIGVTEATVRHLVDNFAYIISENVNVDETRNCIQDFLEAGTGVPEVKPNYDGILNEVTVGWAYDIAYQLDMHKRTLDDIEE